MLLQFHLSAAAVYNPLISLQYNITHRRHRKKAANSSVSIYSHILYTAAGEEFFDELLMWIMKIKLGIFEHIVLHALLTLYFVYAAIYSSIYTRNDIIQQRR